MDWKAIGAAEMLEDNEMTEVSLEDTRVLLARVDGQYYAVQAFCSHMGGKFIRGRLEGCVVSCPRNVSRFDVRDGTVVNWLSALPGLVRGVARQIMPPKTLKVYPTRIENGQVWVAV